MGYDPVFKPHTGPAAIQPAPNSAPAMQQQQPTPTGPPQYPPPQSADYMAPNTAPYGGGGSGVPAGGAPSGGDQFDYASAIDPALEAATAVPGAGGAFYTDPRGPMPVYGEPQSLLSAPYLAQPRHDPAERLQGLALSNPRLRIGSWAAAGKPAKIEEVLRVGAGYLPPAVPPVGAELAPAQRAELSQLWGTVYGPALDKFLETRWFATRGLAHLSRDRGLTARYFALVGRFGITASTHFHENLVTNSLEASVIWDTMLLARQVAAQVASTHDGDAAADAAEGVLEVARRVEILEALLTNTHLDPASVTADPTASTTTPAEGAAPGAATPTDKTTAFQGQLAKRERDFWRLVACFATLQTDPALPQPTPTTASTGDGKPEPTPTQQADALLGEMRVLLDSRENRDVLYSMAVVRHLGMQVQHGGPTAPASAGGTATETKTEGEGGGVEGAEGKPASGGAGPEDEPREKVRVAREFLQYEASGRGTTQVVQRMCGAAVMSWSPRS